MVVNNKHLSKHDMTVWCTVWCDVYENYFTNSSSWYSFSLSKIINYGDEIKIKTWLQHLVNQGRAKQNSLHSLILSLVYYRFVTTRGKQKWVLQKKVSSVFLHSLFHTVPKQLKGCRVIQSGREYDFSFWHFVEHVSRKNTLWHPNRADTKTYEKCELYSSNWLHEFKVRIGCKV